jgi:hypothetical protein
MHSRGLVRHISFEYYLFAVLTDHLADSLLQWLKKGLRLCSKEDPLECCEVVHNSESFVIMSPYHLPGLIPTDCTALKQINRPWLLMNTSKIISLTLKALHQQ